MPRTTQAQAEARYQRAEHLADLALAEEQRVQSLAEQRRRPEQYIEFSDQHPTGTLVVEWLRDPRRPAPEVLAQHEDAIRVWAKGHDLDETEVLESALEVD